MNNNIERKPDQPFYKIWLWVYLRPSIDVYKEILEMGAVKVSRPLAWIAINTAIAAILPPAVYFLSNKTVMTDDLADIMRTGNFGWVMYFLSTFMAIAISPFIFWVGTWVINWLARKMGGTGTFENLAFLLGSIYAPLVLIDATLEILFGLLRLVAIIFAAGLAVIAIRASHRLSLLRSVAVILLPSLIVIAVVGGCLLSLVMIR